MVPGESTITNTRIDVTRQSYLYRQSALSLEHSPTGIHDDAKLGQRFLRLAGTLTGYPVTGNVEISSGITFDGYDISNLTKEHNADGTHKGSITFAKNTHDGIDGGPKLLQANTHEDPDTNTTGAIHHTIGPLSSQVCSGDGTYNNVFKLDRDGSSATAPDQYVEFRSGGQTWGHHLWYRSASGVLYVKDRDSGNEPWRLGRWREGERLYIVPLTSVIKNVNSTADFTYIEGGGIGATGSGTGFANPQGGIGPFFFPDGFKLVSVSIQTRIVEDGAGGPGTPTARFIMQRHTKTNDVTTWGVTTILDVSHTITQNTSGAVRYSLLTGEELVDNFNKQYSMKIEISGLSIVSSDLVQIMIIALGVIPNSSSTV